MIMAEEKREEFQLEEAFGKIEALLSKLTDRNVSLEESFRSIRRV